MLQHYGIGKISDVIHDVTTVICVNTEDDSVTYHHVHSGPSARAVCLGGGGHKNSQGGTKKFFWGAHFVNSIDRRYIKNNTYSTVRLLGARSLDISCCFIEERL